MTTTVTMNTAVLGPSGIMAAGSQQTLADDLAAELIHSKRATRVTPQDTGGGQVFRRQRPGGGLVVDGAGAFGQNIVIDGDSITARFFESAAGTSSSSYFAWFNAYMGHAFTVVNSAAVSGQGSSECLARFDDNVAPYGSAWVSLMVGINNVGTPDQVIADITAYIAKVRGIGAKLLLWSLLPSSVVASDQARRNGWSKVNKFISGLAGTSDDIVVVTAHEAWLDSSLNSATLYAPIAAYVEDGTHPTPLGAQAVGLYAYRLLNGRIGQRVLPAAVAVPFGHSELAINPRANDASTATPTAPLTGTLPQFWSASRESGSAMGGALTVINRTDGTPNKQVRFAFSCATAAERCIIKAGNRGVGVPLTNGATIAQYRRYTHPTNPAIELIAMAGGTASATAIADTASMVVGDLRTAGVQFYATDPIVIGGTYQAFAEVQFEAGGVGAVQPMVNVAIQNGAFANLLLVGALANDGTAYGGITANQDTTPMVIASRPFVMPAGVAYVDAGVRLWSAAGASGALLVKSISVVRLS
jgi:lysophospholipase L1-like esterase